MNRLWIISFIVFPIALMANIVLNEVMLDPATNDDANEFIELFNNSDEAIDLSGYIISDNADYDSIKIFPDEIDFPDMDAILNTTILAPACFAVIIDRDYVDIFNDAPYNFDDGVIVLTTDDYNLGDGLNNIGDCIYLFDNETNLIDSVCFGLSTQGISFERLSPDSAASAPISDDNWQKTPSEIKHTIGSYNTMQPVPNNISLDSVSIGVSSGQVYMSNQGTEPRASGELIIRYLSLEDSTFATLDSANIEVIDTYIHSFSLASLADGIYEFDFLITGDMQDYDNRLVEVTRIGNVSNSLLISEIMFKPENGIEWIELQNNTALAVDIANWRFGDSNAESQIIDSSYIVDAGEFLVLSPDSIASYCDCKNLIPIGPWRPLNNDGDDVVIYDEFSEIGRIEYSAESSFPAGFSLEKPCGSSTGNDYEISQFSGGTPGCINSNCRESNDIAIIETSVDTVSDELIIEMENVGFNAVATGTLYVYDDENFDNIASRAELLWSGEPLSITGSHTFSRQLGLADGLHQLIINIVGDRRQHNNSDTLVYSKNAPSQLVLTEFMNRPFENEPEWVEFYNLSDEDVNISGWELGDGEDQKEISSDISILPGQFLVISDSDMGGPEIIDTCDAQLVIMDSWEPLNNTDDVIVLTDNLGFERFRLEYESDWTKDCMTKGLSYQMYSTEADPQDKDSWWCSKSPGGTPGCFPEPNEPFTLTISKNSFDPNHEILRIDYASPLRTNVRVRVFNIEGRLLHTLLDFDNPQGGNIFWDGKVDGKNLPIGMYVLIADIEPGSGVKKKAIAIVRNIR
ncbi:MAG: lamin tail domain-containing protein [Candidatus Zixiibacteriota bacterium]